MVEFQFFVSRSEHLLSGLKWRGENCWSQGSFAVQFRDDLHWPGIICGPVQLARRDFPVLRAGYMHLLRMLIGHVDWPEWSEGQRVRGMSPVLVLHSVLSFYLFRRALLQMQVTENTFTGNITVPL